MGVGVYSSTFHGTGTTVIVSPATYMTQDEYEAYVSRVEADGTEPLDFEDWCRDLQECQEEDLISALHEQLFDADTGFHIMHADDADRFVGDRAFAAVMENSEFVIGHRSWESDTILGIGPADMSIYDMIVNGEEYDGHCEESFGKPLQRFREDYAARLDLLKEIVIQSLVKAGIEARYKTSGYTTSAYEESVEPDFFESRKAKLASIGNEVPALTR